MIFVPQQAFWLKEGWPATSSVASKPFEAGVTKLKAKSTYSARDAAKIPVGGVALAQTGSLPANCQSAFPEGIFPRTYLLILFEKWYNSLFAEMLIMRE